MRSHKTLATIALFFVALAGLAAKTTPGVTGGASLAAFNRYVFRGYRLGRDSLVLQPAMIASVAGFSISFWGNIDLKENATPSFIPDRPGRKSFNETDLTVSYARNVGNISLMGGFIYYGTKYVSETQELFVGVSCNIWGKPMLMVYRDIDAFPGTYIQLSMAQSLSLAKGISLDLGASAAYFAGSGDYWRTYDPAAGSYSGPLYRTFHDGMIKTALTVPVAKNASLQALTQYYFPLSAAAKRITNGFSYNINGTLRGTWVFGMTLILAY